VYSVVCVTVFMAKQTYFDPSWLKDSRYSNYHSWLEGCDVRSLFLCCLCVKTMKLSNMGMKATVRVRNISD